MRKVLYLIGLMVFFTLSAQAQTPVALAPSVHPQFLDSTGKVLAGGFVYTYQAGTTTRQDTYTDSSGSIINAWPIPLDATGAPSNGSTQTGIWLSNQSYKFCAYNSALVLQWCTDSVSAYQILNGVQNITFGSVTSDPTGAAGEIGYRSDIPCFRGYTTFWDCFLTLTGVQSPTNKSIDISANTLKNSSNTAGHYPRNNGTQYVDSTIQPLDVPGASVSVPNANATGTTLNMLATLTGAPSTAVIAPISNIAGAVGIVISGAGTTGSATIQTSGQSNCIFDGAASAGDYFSISATGTSPGPVAGNCHDTGNYPTGGRQALGRILANSGGGLTSVFLFGPEIQGPLLNVIQAVNLTGLGANISSTPIFTPTANGVYRFSCYTVVTQAATVSSTLPNCQVLWTDADTSISESVNVTNQNATNTVGAIGTMNAGAYPGVTSIYAKSGVAVSYATAAYATNGATSMQYALHIRVEGPF